MATSVEINQSRSTLTIISIEFCGLLIQFLFIFFSYQCLVVAGLKLEAVFHLQMKITVVL